MDVGQAVAFDRNQTSDAKVFGPWITLQRSAVVGDVASGIDHPDAVVDFAYIERTGFVIVGEALRRVEFRREASSAIDALRASSGIYLRSYDVFFFEHLEIGESLAFCLAVVNAVFDLDFQCIVAECGVFGNDDDDGTGGYRFDVKSVVAEHNRYECRVGTELLALDGQFAARIDTRRGFVARDFGCAAAHFEIHLEGV